MKVLTIGYGRHLFDQNNFEYQRLNRCASAVESLDSIIFAKKSAGLTTVSTENNFTIHPTNSNSKLTMVFDAVRIGSQLIREKEIDVISTQDVFETGLVGLLLKHKFPQVTLQVQEHGDVLASPHWRKEKLANYLRYRFALYLVKHADSIRVVSKRTEEYVREQLGEEKVIKRLPVVIDTSTFATEPASQQSDSKDTFTFITAARFVPQKNFPLMLEAFAEVYQSIPQVRLKIFGDGPDKTKFINLIDSLGLREVVSIENWTNNLAREMLHADAYLLTSNYEGWARVLIEAMMLNLPIVTTDVGCANEVVKDMEHGLIVPVDDRTQLISAMKRIVLDVRLYAALKQRLQSFDKSSIPGTDIDAYAKRWADTMR